MTWPLVITCGPENPGKTWHLSTTADWPQQAGLCAGSHTGVEPGFLERLAAKHPGQLFPIAVALGLTRRPSWVPSHQCPTAFPSTRLPDFAGENRSYLPVVCMICRCLPVPSSFWRVPVPGETAPEGPFGDHTGYYNEVDDFPVFTVERITHRKNPIYHSTHWTTTG